MPSSSAASACAYCDDGCVNPLETDLRSGGLTDQVQELSLFMVGQQLPVKTMLVESGEQIDGRLERHVRT
jgi:hypothetical protein